MNQQKQLPAELTVVVNTCDSYSDVLKIFFLAFKKHWPDCPYPIVINTETNQHSTYPARIHNYKSATGEDDWGARLLSTLQSIKTKYVLMLYDDFILEEKIDINRITEAIDLLKNQANADVAYLVNTSLPMVQTENNLTFAPLIDLEDYKLNSAPGIWVKSSLERYTAKGDTPWAWEVFGTYRTWRNGRLFFSLNKNKPDIYSYNYSKGGAIYRGKWVKEVVEKVKENHDIDIDWSKRGFSSEHSFEKRSTMWKIRFMQKGFEMVGFKALYFICNNIKNKLHAH